jgi:cytochrome oxidase Cu insertion factor (SCO1/SenC/PrrC family)
VSTPPGTSPAASPRPRADNWEKALLVILGVAVIIAGVLIAVAVRRTQSAAESPNEPAADVRADGIPASVPTSLAYAMGLSPVPAKTAPAFSLSDQRGRTVSLADFKGRVVVLEFMDPNCIDICPIVSAEFIDAYRDLGADPDVAFLAVNVNVYHRSVADMAAYTAEHSLSSVPTWHFLTGAAASLSDVWRGYGVAVSAPSPTADIVHTSVVYFIDPQGRERYLAVPTVDHSSTGAAYLPGPSLAAWGKGIALVAKSLRS